MKVLFCGLGSIGQRHLRNLRTILGNDVEVIAYREVSKSPVLNADMTVRSGASLERLYGVRSFKELDEALAQKPDIAFITNPNSLHVPVALAAADAGCHLFLEKPISHSTEGVAELVELVDQKKLIAFVAYQYRFHPGLRLLKSLIDQKVLGNLLAAHIVNGEFMPDWHPYENYRESHASRRSLGGGCLSIQTHEIDYAIWLFGLPRKVFACGGKLSHLDVDVEDSVSMLLHCEYESRPLPVHIHLDYLQRPPQRVCEIVGDSGKARYDYYAGTVAIHHHADKEVEICTFKDFDRNQMFLDELTHFLDCLNKKSKPLVDLHEGLASLRTSLAAYESLKTGNAIEIRT